MSKEWDLFVLISENNITTEELAIFNDISLVASSWWLNNMKIERLLSKNKEIYLDELCKCYEKTLRDEILRILIQRKPFVLYYIAGNSSKELMIASQSSEIESSYPDNSTMEYNNGVLKVSTEGKKPKVLYSLKGGHHAKGSK